MSLRSSTESLLLNSSHLDTDESTTESFSTEALLNDYGLSSSTGSLVNESVQELLNRLHIPDTSLSNSDSSDSTVLSPILDNSSILQEETNRLTSEGHPNARIELKEEISPLLALLYNKIQVFLLRNKLSLEFLRIYKRYVECLLEAGLNPLEDRYFRRLQNELSESYEFTPRMEEILDAFLIDPQNLIMKLALFEHRRLRNLLRRLFEAWEWNCEARGSLRQLEDVWQEFLRRKYLLFWSKKLQVVVVESNEQGKEFRRFNLLSSTFDQWLGRIETVEARNGLADHYLMDHALQRLVKRMNDVSKKGKQAIRQYDTVTQKTLLKQWRLRSRERKFISRQLNLKRLFFSQAKSKQGLHQESEERAAFARRLLLLSSSFDIWRSQCLKEGERLNSLVVLEIRFIKSKTLQLLSRSYKERQQEAVARRCLDIIALSLFFNKVWKTRFEERLHFYSFQRITEERLVTKYTRNWKVRFFSRIKAGSFMGSQLSKRYFYVWRLEAKSSDYNTLNRKRTLRAHFLMWRNRSVSERKVRHFQFNSFKQNYYRKWQDKLKIIREAVCEAEAMYDFFLITRFYSRWSRRVTEVAEMNDRSRIFMTLKAISIIKHGIGHINSVRDFSEMCDTSPITKNALLRFFNLWKEFSTVRRSERLEYLFQMLEKNLQQNSQRYYLQLWLEKTTFYRSQCLHKAVQVYHKNLQIKGLLLVGQKFEKTKLLTKVGDELRVKYLSLNFFNRWKDQYSQAQGLLLRLETENNKKNLALLLNYLNYWSMKILKLNRNDETVQIFRRRWDRAAVRGLMLLWKNKADETRSKIPRHQSPLNSGLVTPVRRSSLKNGTIPGSEGVKRYRLEAMKSHYGKIRRAIPSPIKSSTTLNSIAKKNITGEADAFILNTRNIPSPRLSLERINKNLASKIDRINFERIPETKLDPFTDDDFKSDPRVDTSFLEEDEDIEFDESPIRRM